MTVVITNEEFDILFLLRGLVFKSRLGKVEYSERSEKTPLEISEHFSENWRDIETALKNLRIKNLVEEKRGKWRISPVGVKVLKNQDYIIKEEKDEQEKRV